VGERFDALVIGGGPGGATVASLLAQAGWSVLLLERKIFPRRKVCGEYLSATSLPLLDRLGIGEVFRASAGPPVTHVGFFAGTTRLKAKLPRPGGNRVGWGQALAREHLDTMLLAEAARAGVEVRQPWSAVELVQDGEGCCCRAKSHLDGTTLSVYAPVTVAAHGSWEPGPLPTQESRYPIFCSDLFGFKAHFRNSDLPPGLMPLLAFPGGYGGMVHCDRGQVSLSCCIRRDRLAQIRRGFPSCAADAVLAYLEESCRGVRDALAGAVQVGDWLAAGPIRPGIRLRSRRGVFAIGNAAGEAHPVVAEGISMAMQAAWLLARRLISWRRQGGSKALLPRVSEDYTAAWKRSFAPRLYVSSMLAHWAMRPAAVTGVLPLLRWFPGLLSWGARLSGKATRVVRC
jgi:flavin-dependent dehydrogenase